jgi:hypothetical protein
MWLTVGLIYIVPTFVAFLRRHPNRWAILAVNVAFGSTGFGWVGALVRACHAVHWPSDPAQCAGGESGLNIFVNDPQIVRVESGSGPMALSGGADLLKTVAQIEQLARLRDQGHLTASEHDVLKVRVLRPTG